MVIVAARASQMRRDSPQAADLVLRARAAGLLEPRSLEREQRVAQLYRQVLALEPDHVGAMIGLANMLVDEAVEYSYRFDEPTRARKFDEAHQLALTVKERDPRHPGPYRIISYYARSQGDFAASRQALEEWVSMNPKNVGALNTLSISYFSSGEPRRAIEILTRAIDLAPRSSWLLQTNMGRAYFMAGDYDTALLWLSRARQGIREPPRILWVYLAMTYAEKGDDANARAMTAELLRHSPDFRASQFDAPRPTHPAAYKEYFNNRFLPAARKAGIPE
jgi:tetratricopeptide (TPR) repeat protein